MDIFTANNGAKIIEKIDVNEYEARDKFPEVKSCFGNCENGK